MIAFGNPQLADSSGTKSLRPVIIPAAGAAEGLKVGRDSTGDFCRHLTGTSLAEQFPHAIPSWVRAHVIKL